MFVAPQRLWFALVLALVLPAQAGAGSFDYEETHPANEGSRLDVSIKEGFLLVQTWGRDEVKLRADEPFSVTTSRHRMRVGTDKNNDECHKCGDSLDIEIFVPEWMEVRVRGNDLEVEMEGIRGRVDVDVIDGDVFLDGGREQVDLRSVHGSITVHDAEADIELISPNDDIELRDCEGKILAETVNGDVRMEGIRSDSVDVVTTNGDVLYDGSLGDDGIYTLITHGGDVNVSVGRDANLKVHLVSYEGEFEHALPERLGELRPGRPLEFELGDGSGRLRVETFSGDIRFFDPKRGRSKRGK